MPLTDEKRAQMQAIMQQTQGGSAPPSLGGGLTPEKRAAMQAIMQQTQEGQYQTPQQPTEQPGAFQSFVQGVAKPFEKPIASVLGAVQGTGSLIGAGLTKLSGGDPQAQLQKAQEAMTKERDFGYFGKARPVGVQQETGERLGFAEGTKDILGTGAELGSYLAPGKIVGAGVKAYKGVVPLGKTIAGTAKAGGLAGGLFSGGAEAQRPESTVGSIAGEALKGGAIGAVTAPLFPLAGAGIKGTGKLAYKGFEKAAPSIAKGASEIAGKYTGAGAAAFEEVLKSENVMKFAREFGDRPEVLLRDALSSARNNLAKMTEKSYAEYSDALSKIRMDPTKMENILNTIKSKAFSRLASGDIAAVVSKTPEGKYFINWSNSPLVRDRNLVEAAFNDIANWTDSTPAGLDVLKKRIDVYRRQAEGPARSYIGNLRHTVRDELVEKVSGYKKMVNKSEEAINLQEEMEKALSIGSKKDIDQASRRLMSVLRQNNEVRRDFLRTLQEQGGENVMEKLAAAQLAPAMPRGITGAFGSIGSVSSFLAGGFPGVLLHLFASSPRLMGEFFDLMRKIKQFGGKEVPSIYQMQLRDLMKKAQEQFEKDLRGEGQPKLLGQSQTIYAGPGSQESQMEARAALYGFLPKGVKETTFVKPTINPGSFPEYQPGFGEKTQEAIIKRQFDDAETKWIESKKALLKKDLTENELRREIDKYIEEFRKRSGLLAQREGAGSHLREVKDAVGDTAFITNDWSLTRAKKTMADMAKSGRAMAREELMKNDPIFQALVKMLEQKDIPF